MPTYEYYCPSNQQTLEVMHGMSRQVSTWGELCEVAEQETGRTPREAPVEKLLSAGMVLAGQKETSAMDCRNPGMRPGGCCGGGCAMG